MLGSAVDVWRLRCVLDFTSLDFHKALGGNAQFNRHSHQPWEDEGLERSDACTDQAAPAPGS